ncbi:isomerase 1 [Perilla frutescens var. hirtella]|uniref:Isomerase 1 n=1 Tax=Perilla frutescens var. hirtella TaxID=608512 RepID=A0AAD4PAA6_PERFH|nr:isomerase 1 [Perilla frutescens var. hirtella]
MALFDIHHPWAFTFGILGNIISVLVYLAPLPTFIRIYKEKSTLGFDSLPYAVALFSAMLWMYYALLKTNAILLISINLFGCCIETAYIFIFLLYASKKARTHTAKILGLMNMGLLCLIFVLTFFIFEGHTRAQVVGWICVGVSVCVFAAPLSIVCSYVVRLWFVPKGFMCGASKRDGILPGNATNVAVCDFPKQEASAGGGNQNDASVLLSQFQLFQLQNCWGKMEEVYKSLQIKPKSTNSAVFDLLINRPSRGNALSPDFFTEFPRALSSLDANPEVSVIVLSGAGKHFCTGIDIQLLNSTTSQSGAEDRGRAGEKIRRDIKWMQRAVTAVEECRKPVIAAVHGACIGGGVDIITACDLRYCTEEAYFSVKEVEMGITADLGTLQRLPAIVGFGNAMELALTSRRFSGVEAKHLGLVAQVFTDKGAMDTAVAQIAEGIAGRSPLAVIGTKRVLLQSRDLALEQGLDYVATWNAGVVVSDDLKEAISAHLHKRKPVFAKL